MSLSNEVRMSSYKFELVTAKTSGVSLATFEKLGEQSFLSENRRFFCESSELNVRFFSKQIATNRGSNITANRTQP